MDKADRPQTDADAAALFAAEQARDRLDSRRPAYSAKRIVTTGQFLAACGAAGGVTWFALAQPSISFEVWHWAAFAVFAAAVLLRAGAAIASLVPPPPPPLWRGPLASYALLVPLHREAAVADDLVRALGALNYPKHLLDIVLILEADDAETRNALEAALAVSPGPFRIITVAPGAPRTKPKALNVALASVTAEYVAVYDAEDRPHPDQLLAALTAFHQNGPHCACVQAPLFIDNAGAGWIARQFSAEYAIHFGQIVPFLCRLGAAPPLGGTSNHFRRAALEAVDGWDPYNVTEDADLGYRLARFGYRIGWITPPTYEEAPERFGPWLRQRTRWLKGHMQTWLVLMRAPFSTWRAMGTKSFLAMQMMLAGGVLAAFVHGPLLALLVIALATPHAPLQAADWWLAASGYATALACALCAAYTRRDWRIAATALSMPLYWPLSFLAAVRALLELVVAPHYWAKTDHALAARKPFVCQT